MKHLPRKVVVFGATSGIAQEAIRLFAEDRDELFLVGRNEGALQALAEDARVRGASYVRTAAADLDDFARHEALWAEAKEALSGVDVVLVAHGVLGDQQKAQQDYAEAEKILRTNFLSVVSLLTPVANDLERQGRGVVAVLSSVAGDRGRQSNYVYGASKGALTTFLQGLRNRLARSGVRVVTVKPGFVATPMTAHLKQGPLFADPGAVARGIHDAIEDGADEVYLPGYWRGIMGVVKAIPEPIFKRMRL